MIPFFLPGDSNVGPVWVFTFVSRTVSWQRAMRISSVARIVVKGRLGRDFRSLGLGKGPPRDEEGLSLD